jgi:hypothetical protein
VTAAYGHLFAADFRRLWCRVLTDDGNQWTLYFGSDEGTRIQTLLNRRVYLTFTTRSPASSMGGMGELRHIGGVNAKGEPP